MPEKDWKVDKVSLTGDVTYPYRVEGRNLNHPPGHVDRHFRWRVPSVTCDRYDFADTEMSAAVRARLSDLGVVTN